MWTQLISSIAGLGVPGLVLLVTMSLTGYAGAAALTAALAALGGPFGMLGGILALGVLALMSKGLAEYGLEAIFDAVLDRMVESGKDIDSIIDEVEKMPLVASKIKSAIISMLRERRLGREQSNDRASGQGKRTVLVSSSRNPSLGQIIDAWDPVSGGPGKVQVLMTGTVSDICVECLVPNTSSFVWCITWEHPDRIALSPSSSLGLGSAYRLKKYGSNQEIKIMISTEIVRGCWLGINAEPDGDSEQVLVVAGAR